MPIRRIYEAYLLTRASALADRGAVELALGRLNRLPSPSHNKAIVEGLRAYLQIVNGETGEARASVDRARANNLGTALDRRFVAAYCDYLEAMLDNRIEDFNRLSLELSSMRGGDRPRSFLIVDRPVVTS